MTASAITMGSTSGKGKLVLAGLVLMSLLPLYALALRIVPTDHADTRHNGEQYPPKAIRACLANLVTSGIDPYQYESPLTNKVAIVCRLDFNRYGVQFNFVTRNPNGSVTYDEITTFYSTLSRVRNILLRDGYDPVLPLPDSP